MTVLNLYSGIQDMMRGNSAALHHAATMRMERDRIGRHAVMSFSLDGASVNMGRHSGLLARWKKSHNNLTVGIHCAGHNAALGVKDADRSIRYMNDVVFRMAM
jgi:hypothetical protein